jgi:hypothetical protein
VTAPLRLVRLDGDPITALELQTRSGAGWFITWLPARRHRLRLRYLDWPQPALVLVDTPRPGCTQCQGEGGHTEAYGHPDTGEDFIPCGCWRPYDEPRLTVRVPLWVVRLRRRRPPCTSTEPPF